MTTQKKNYQKELDLILEKIKFQEEEEPEHKKPTLLLHACCGPCSSYVIEYLSKFFDITIYYYNPNIHPRQEYFRRLEELKKFLTQFPDAIQNKVKLVEDEYNPEDYFEQTNVRLETELQTEPEKGERCRRCYKFRMERAYKYACKNNFDWFTTTLSISPHKDSEKINTIGRMLENENTKFLPADFKKKGGFLRSTQLSEEYGLWRQDYCGCVYSKQNMKNK
ncbi:MAG: epoxyqueuosine reductase QueH [Treponema sp.]|nr:epoxyqueuosine reductase QueH [Treponema sp.]